MNGSKGAEHDPDLKLPLKSLSEKDKKLHKPRPVTAPVLSNRSTESEREERRRAKKKRPQTAAAPEKRVRHHHGDQLFQQCLFRYPWIL